MFKVGNTVKMAPMWKYACATGTVIKISKDYVVVRWNDINGEWHYTEEQAKKIEVLND
jgi:hypothetical protein